MKVYFRRTQHSVKLFMQLERVKVFFPPERLIWQRHQKPAEDDHREKKQSRHISRKATKKIQEIYSFSWSEMLAE